MALQNSNLVIYQLLSTLGEADRFWMDLSTLKHIDLTTVTDEDIDFLVAQYPDWAGIVVEEATEGWVIFGGAFIGNGDSINIKRADGEGYEASSIIPLETLTPIGDFPMVKIGYLRQFNEESTIGVMYEMHVLTTDISYIGGQLPSYCTAISMVEVGLETFDISQFPASLRSIDLSDNRLGASAIEKVIVNCNESGAEDGTLLLTGPNMAAPNSKAQTAITQLLAKGWEIETE